MKTQQNDPGQRSNETCLQQWYATPLGTLLGAQEQACLEGILPNLFGYHLLHLGPCDRSLLSASRILHRVVINASERTDVEGEEPRLIARSAALPVSSDSIDATLLYHALEMSSDPHGVLREVERILVPEGHLVILGFNPRSLWGVMRAVPRRERSMPWGKRYVSVSRLKDWLALLGFEVLRVDQVFYRPPFRRLGILDKLNFMERWGRRWWPFFGASYILVARKKVSTITPVKPRWRPRRSLVGTLTDPASRSRCDG